MRNKFIAILALLIAGSVLSGCIIDPGGYDERHRHHDHDRD